MLGIRKIFSNRVLLQKLKSNKRFMGSAGHHDDHHDDHGHHEHMMPPFARLPPPDKAMLPEEVELVWNDQVAPETCVDFDAPEIGMGDVFYAYGWMLLFLGGVYGLIAYSDPAERQPVARREFVIPFNGLKRELGEDDDSADDEEH